MPNLKFYFSCHICAAGQPSSRAATRRRTPPCSLTYLSKSDRGDIRAPERVADLPASLYHLKISLEMIIFPFFMIIFLFPSISTTIGGYIPVTMIISINYYD